MKQAIITGLLFSGLTMATATSAVPNNFSSGQPARAADVNANFADVENQIGNNTSAITTNTNNIGTNTTNISTNAGNITTNANGISTNATGVANNAAAIAAIQVPVIYDFNAYRTASSITSKVYTLSGSFCGETATRTFTRTPNGTNTDVTMRRVWTNTGTTCHIREFHSTITPTESLLTGSTRYSNSGAETGVITIASPISRLNSTMQLGIDFGSASLYTLVPTAGPNTTDMIIENNVILGVESITVPAGTYQNCLKIGTTRRSTNFGSFQRIAWRCPGLGEVKRMQNNLDGSAYRIWEMNQVISALP